MFTTALRRTFLPNKLSCYSTRLTQRPAIASTRLFLLRNIQTLAEQPIPLKKALDTSLSNEPITPENENASLAPTTTSQALPEKLEPRLSITFTCTVPECFKRSTHTFTKRSYERGIVLVQCPECKNRHLIADNLGWFKDSTGEGKLKNIEDILREKGEKVRRGRLHADGVVEYSE